MRHLRRPRAGFTLIELLVVIAIMGILMSLIGAAVFKTITVRKRSFTQQSVDKLYLQLQRHMKAVIDDARTEQIPPAVLALAGNDPNRARIVWIKLRLKQQFPQSYAEALQPAPGYINPEPAYGRILAGRSAANKPETESAACLLMALTARTRRGVEQSADFLSPNEKQDTDGDGIPEICDAYGKALAFFRWPTPPSGDPNFTMLTAAPPGGVNPNPSAPFQDPQDPTGTLQAGGWGGLAGVGIPTPNQYMVPVIVSAGADGRMGLNANMSVSVTLDNQDNIYSR